MILRVETPSCLGSDVVANGGELWMPSMRVQPDFGVSIRSTAEASHFTTPSHLQSCTIACRIFCVMKMSCRLCRPGSAMARKSSNSVADIVPMQLTDGDEAAHDGTSTTCCKTRLHADVQYEIVILASRIVYVSMLCMNRGVRRCVSLCCSFQ